MNIFAFVLLISVATASIQDSCDKDGNCAETDEIRDAKYLNLPYCDESAILGPVKVDLTRTPLQIVEKRYAGTVLSGGRWSPNSDECRSRQTIAVVVPYRRRELDLLVFLNHMHTFLQSQRNAYIIILVEQDSSKNFNRGSLLNIGVLRASTFGAFDCVILHDIDKFPEDTRNSYTCRENPHHLIGRIVYENDSKYRKEPYDNYFGGVTSIFRKQFLKTNGFSNDFWGWGSEDDDFYNRIKFHGLNTSRSERETGNFQEIYHPYGFVNPRRHEVVKEGKVQYLTNGVNNVNFRIIDTQLSPLYTNITVSLLASDPYTT